MISKKIEESINFFETKLGTENAFDIVIKELKIGGKKAALVFVDGFANGDVITLIMQNLVKLPREELYPNPLDKLLSVHIPYMDMETKDNYSDVVDEVLAGLMAIIIDGEKEIIVVDAREYPARTPEEPEIERVTRGSRDGFVETLIFNIALIRRRLRDPSIRTEIYKIGQRGKTDVSLIYLNDVADPEILDRIRSRLQNIDIDALPMAEKSVEEFITGGCYNPFPKVRYTERPDVAAMHLLEGHVVLVVDNSPSVMIAPVTYFHHIQHAEEYRQNVPSGIYLRWTRFIGVLISVLLAPLWLLISTNRELIPEALEFIGPEEIGNIPLFLQLIIANFGIDLIKMASVHTPSSLATALGLIGALIIGEIAVEVGFFTIEVLLYVGLVVLGVFITPSWELSLANRIAHLFLLLMTGFFNLIGFASGIILVLILLVRTRSFGIPYMWPLVPFHWGGLVDILIRKPVSSGKFRPSILRPQDKDRIS